MARSRASFKTLLSRLEKPIRDTWLQAIAEARSFAKIKALMEAIQTGDTDRILLAAGIRDGMYTPMTESVRNAYMAGGMDVLRNELPKRIALSFDINNPRAVEWLRKKAATEIAEALHAETRAAVQRVLTDGMLRGNNPRTIALDIVGRIGPNGRRSGGVLGLTDQQAGFVLNMRDDLDDLNWQRYKSRRLRDKRFDSVVKKAAKEGKPIPKKTRDRIIESYENRMMKYRGDTIGRTEALRALNESGDEAMRQVVENGMAPSNAVSRIWKHSFSRNERQGHKDLDGEERGLDEPFVNPITGAVLKHPGDVAAGPGETINCRCHLEYKVDFVAVELAA